MGIRGQQVVNYTVGVDAAAMLAGYRKGWFAMPYMDVLYQWFSPNPRGVLPVDRLRVTRSLRKSAARYTVSFDQDFESVLAQCADPGRPGGWIDGRMRGAYRQLHQMGHAHSIETRDDAGSLVGGLFVVNIGGFVSGESMFHLTRDASKVALVSLVERLRTSAQPILLDTQWATAHLGTLGVVEIPRREYLSRLGQVIDAPSVW